MRTTDNVLAQFLSLAVYQPRIGDFIIKQGFFSTKFGIVLGVTDSVLHVAFERMPCLLFTMTPEEQKAATKQVSYGAIVTAWRGTYTVMQSDAKSGVGVWYV
jgi:hypothetical protein